MTTNAVASAEAVSTPQSDNSLLQNAFELTMPFEKEAFATSRGKKVRVFHRLARPSQQQLQERDAKQPYRSQDIGNDEEQVLADVSGRADVQLYNELVLATEGYSLNVSEQQSAEERKAALATIPPAHKQDMIRAIVSVDSEVVYDDSEDEAIEVVLWGDGQTYRVRTEIGDAGQFVAYSTLREPTQREIENFNAGSTKFVLEKGQRKPVTKITVSLAPAVQLFDSLVESVEGLTVNGETIDVSDKRQLALIDAYMKRSVVDAVMKATRLDLGN